MIGKIRRVVSVLYVENQDEKMRVCLGQMGWKLLANLSIWDSTVQPGSWVGAEKDRKATGQLRSSGFSFTFKRKKLNGVSEPIYCSIILALRIFGYEYNCSLPPLSDSRLDQSILSHSVMVTLARPKDGVRLQNERMQRNMCIFME